MLLAVDVHYGTQLATTAGVSFDDWGAAEPLGCFVAEVAQVAAYVPGEFFQRELPCILHLLQETGVQPDCILIDGYVYLDGVSRPGLGKHLFDALGGRTKVVGVAKTAFAGIDAGYQVLRGGSSRPLYVTCIGEELSVAKAGVAAMHGEHRIPTLLRAVDQLCRRSAGVSAST